jgi:DDB1- and CUL4-associated factor 7
MPFQNNYQQQNSQSNPPYPQDNYYSAANAAYLTGQPLNSAVAPPNQWANSKSTPSAASGDRAYQSQNLTNGNGVAEQGLSLRPGPPTYGAQTLPSNPQPSNNFQTPRRTLTSGRGSEELHIPQTGSAMSDVHHYGAPPAYGGESAIQYQQMNPQQSSTVASNPLPSSLQPGLSNRPMSYSNNTAQILPTLPQISTQMQQPPASGRSIPVVHSHSYSRSSPGGMDQPKYKPFSNTPEASKYTSPTSTYVPQTPQGASSYSPLGLADIRPRTDAALPDGALSPGVLADYEALQYPSNSNHMTPWPIYALDWCKWPPRSNTSSAGKIAIGSYLEDNHNFVRSRIGEM